MFQMRLTCVWLKSSALPHQVVTDTHNGLTKANIIWCRQYFEYYVLYSHPQPGIYELTGYQWMWKILNILISASVTSWCDKALFQSKFNLKYFSRTIFEHEYWSFFIVLCDNWQWFGYLMNQPIAKLYKLSNNINCSINGKLFSWLFFYCGIFIFCPNFFCSKVVTL